jgi:hypothetical protein
MLSPYRFYQLLNPGKTHRIFSCPLERPIKEVDYKSARALVWPRIKILAPNVREDDIGVARIGVEYALRLVRFEDEA